MQLALVSDHPSDGSRRPPACPPGPVYRVDRRELDFFLWEASRLEADFLGAAPFQGVDRAQINALLDAAEGFAAKLAASYQASDRNGAYLAENGEVVVPQAYPALWEEFKQKWCWIRRMGERTPHPIPWNIERVPPLVVQAISEMFMGANPAFMTYGGFTAFALRLIEQHGTDSQKALFLDKLGRDEWDACFCATEIQAGSDLTAIATSAEALGGDVYAIEGHKKYITAGMHTLTENTVCILVARVKDTSRNAFSLSCFLVPQRWVAEDGRLVDNHVECVHVEDKMGFNGCANTHMVFGAKGPTRGFLLGNRGGVALAQLITLMRSARISTGQFGLAMASSAYLHSLNHARTRIQGRRFTEISDASAELVPIIEHLDVQRMLLDMRAKVEGCRGLIGKLVRHLTHIEQLKAAPQPDTERIDRHHKLVLLYTPIIKAYVSDEAWRVATVAIQVHGGVGYLRDCPVEQYARDIKVLSIWEGTNYMQAQDLLRDKLSYGRNSTLMRYFEEDIRGFLAQGAQHPALAEAFDALAAAVCALCSTLEHIRSLAERGEFLAISQFCTRFLEMFAEVILGWVHLESAVVAEQALADLADENAGRAFYVGKIKLARFYLYNSLPAVAAKAAILRDSKHSFAVLSDAEFAYPAVAAVAAPTARSAA